MNSQDMSIYWNQRKGQYETNNFYQEQQSPFTITADRRLKYTEETIEDEETNESESSVSIGGWFGMLILMLVPGINILAILITAFASKNENKKAFARAFVLLTLILLTVVLVGMALTCEKVNYQFYLEKVLELGKLALARAKNLI